MRRLSSAGLEPSPGVKRAVILADGEPPSAHRLKRAVEQAACFIALDGAGAVALRLGQRPDCIVGDLDSLDQRQVEGIPLVFDPDQETNDLEKGLHWLLKQGFTHVHVLGATGKRLDHTLKNLSVLKQFNDKVSCHFEDELAQLVLMTPRHPDLELVGEVGQSVSLFPLSGRVEGIFTSGLAYPLHHEALENGVRDGSSNALVQARAHVQLRAGDLLVYLVHPPENLS